MSQTALRTFICYAHEDHEVVEGLKKQLVVFEKKGLLQIWSDGKILPGEHWDKSIKIQLEQAELILLFISVDFINSDYIETTELKAAFQRHRDGQATLVPIIVRPCHWTEYFDMGQFQALPPKARPILSNHFPHRDEAFFEIADGLKKTAEALRAQKVAAAAQAEKQAAAEQQAAEKAAAAAEAAREATERQTRQADIRRQKDEASWQFACEDDTLHAYETYLEDGFILHQAEAKQRVHNFQAAELKRRAADKAKAEAERQVKDLVEKKAREEAAAKAKAEAERQARAATKKKVREEEVVKTKAELERFARALAENKVRKEEAASHTDPFHDLMLPIKGGTFDMGDTFGDGSTTEKPVHRVTIKDFHLCKYPVTQGQWKKVMGKNPASFQGGGDLPVETVSWDDVQDFIQKLNQQLPAGQKPYRLPTEAEWEYAAREGGKKVRFGNGKDIADPNEMNFNASKDYKKSYSVGGECRQKTTPVTQFKPNALGLYDMSGNVWEWCQDVWHDNYEGASTDGSAWVQGGNGLRRTVRGGSWYYYPSYCRAACRDWYITVTQSDLIGFRLAR